MISIFRKLIMKEWFKAFFISFAALCLVVTITNLISDFLRSKAVFIEVLYNHILEFPNFISRILPISCLMASLFSINKLKNTNELVAIFSFGVSRKQVIGTILMCAIVVSLFQFANNSFIMPYVLSKRDVLMKDPQHKFRNLQDQGLKSKTIDSGSVWYKGKNYYASFPLFQKAEKKLIDLNLYYFSDTHKIVRHIYAYTATFDEQKNHWIGRKVIDLKKIDDENNFFELTKNDSIAIDLLERPKDFDQIESDISVLNIFKLKSYIDKLKDLDVNTNDFLVLYLEKYTSLFICIIFSLMSCTGVFSPNRRGASLGKNILFVFVFTITYWIFSSYVLELGRSSRVNPYLACFLVPTVFILFLSAFYIRNRKLISLT